MSIELAIRLKKALQAAGMTQADIAREMGESPQTVGAWMKTGRIAKKKLVEFARITKANLGYLMTGDQPAPATLNEKAPPYPAHGSGVQDVPIIGFAIANPDEDGYFDDMGFPPGGGEGYIPWPTRDPNAYALRVKGDSMSPRIRAGELIVVEPGTAASPGDEVLAKTKSGRKMVKELLYRRGGEITLGSVNQTHKQLTISLEDIESIQFVAGIIRRGAQTKEET